VAPAIAVVLLVRRAPRTASASSTLSHLVLALMVWTSLTVLNPLGGLRSNAVGLLFIGAPLLWFFVGRDIVDRATASVMLRCELVVAAVVAVYGLAQTNGYWTSWDKAWLSVAGYAALHVGGLTRAFGTFASGAEYSSFISLAVVGAVGLALHRRVLWLLLVPLLAFASFYDGSRGVIVLTLTAVILQIGLRTRRTVIAVVVVAVGVAAAVGGMHAYKTTLLEQAAQSNNAIVQHQIGGLASPLDSSKSTLPAHWRLFVQGFTQSFSRPLGAGPGSTSLAATRFGGAVASTEVDISNEFSAVGIPGGLLFVAIFFLVWKRVLVVYRRAPDPVVLAAAGILLVLVGQWLNGGYYAVAPLVWLLIGWLEGEWVRLQAQEAHI
jgi:hypothetical protein